MNRDSADEPTDFGLPNDFRVPADWNERLAEGDTEITNILWELYFHRMVRVARKRLRGSSTAARDEEDIALSAFKSFCMGVKAGQYEPSSDSPSLWQLLVRITMNKAVDQIRYANRLKRGGGEPTGEGTNVKEIASAQPPAAMCIAADETLERILERLRQSGDSDLEIIALASIEGNTTTEISSTLGCSPRTIQRKLKTIQAIWKAVANEQ